MKKTLLFIAIAMISLIAACASIVKGTKQVMTIDSNIKGAEITLNGKVIGQTPFIGEVVYEKADTHYIELKKEGYKTTKVNVVSKTSGWFWGNILLGGTTGSSTDSSTGAMYEYAPDKYFINMEPATTTALQTEKVKKSSQIRYFVLMNYDRINADIAKGKGEYLNSMYSFFGASKAADQKEILTSLSV